MTRSPWLDLHRSQNDSAWPGPVARGRGSQGALPLLLYLLVRPACMEPRHRRISTHEPWFQDLANRGALPEPQSAWHRKRRAFGAGTSGPEVVWLYSENPTGTGVVGHGTWWANADRSFRDDWSDVCTGMRFTGRTQLRPVPEGLIQMAWELRRYQCGVFLH